jgi:hypothetical protein
LKLHKIKILGKDYKVTYVPKIENVNTIGTKDILMGQIAYTEGQIRIFGGLGYFDNLQTMLHEIVHGIAVALVVELDEKQTDLLATGLANVLIDNKMLRDNGKSS